jgi:hypothetical protein
MYGKIVAAPDQRDALVEHMLRGLAAPEPLITKAKPLIAGLGCIRLTPIGGADDGNPANRLPQVWTIIA